MTPLLNQLTHKLHSMPVLVLMPHSRCNCRCVMVLLEQKRDYFTTSVMIVASPQMLATINNSPQKY